MSLLGMEALIHFQLMKLMRLILVSSRHTSFFQLKAYFNWKCNILFDLKFTEGFPSSKVKVGLQILLDMPNTSMLNCSSKHLRKVTKDNAIKYSIKSNYKVKKKRIPNHSHGEGFLTIMPKLCIGNTKRSSKKSVIIDKEEAFARVYRQYWFSGGVASRSTGIMRSSKAKYKLLDQAILNTLPDNFAWILQYFACYGFVSNLEILQELADIENLILHLDQDYFGMLKSVRINRKKGNVQRK